MPVPNKSYLNKCFEKKKTVEVWYTYVVNDEYPTGISTIIPKKI